MKLNLGCGPDDKSGYINVDFFDERADEKVDLSKFPWPWQNDSIDEILMLDFLEHFPVKETPKFLEESWRILKMEGRIIIQVPDLEHCARVICRLPPFICGKCYYNITSIEENCPKCKVSMRQIEDNATQRLYGGQEKLGNWHYTTFTRDRLKEKLTDCGFEVIGCIEEPQHYNNWNFKMEAKKVELVW